MTRIRRHEVYAVMHFAAFLDVGESVREPARYYRNNVVGALSVLEAMAAEAVTALRASRRPARPTASRSRRRSSETHPQRPINSYGETKLAVERALPHFERAHGMHSMALRYFNAAGADPDGEIGEDHSPEIHLIPRAIDAAHRRTGLQVFGDDYPTPDGTCLRDYIHVDRPRGRPRQGARGARRNGEVGRLQPRHGPAAFGARGDQRCRARDGTSRCRGRSAPRRPGDPAVSTPRRRKAQAELHWTPRFAGDRR